ncbi:transporter [Rhodopseudomonas sp. HC1]|uniref:transporter n=1 Tax=Rhodopseudomonas infernalis TaxID=2897386 RepID=UPI001EE91DE8|nr:transporter [Rhodopseudomonas infernalis]MCG6203481.1 transporter [Rhodopseudomonas infernalis]
MQQLRPAAGAPSLPPVPADALLPGLVWAFRFAPDGTPQPMSDAALVSEPGGWCWLHFNLADARALQWLASADLPPRARQLLLSKDSYQQMHGSEDCVYGVVADLKRDIADITDDTGFLRFVMTENLLISGRHQALCAVDATRRALERGRRIESAAALFETIIDEVADAMERVVDGVEHELDHIEEKVLSDDTADVRQGLGQTRRSCVRLHRHLSGLRIVLHRFERDSSADLKPSLQLRAGKLAQRLDSLDHSVVEMRERSRLLQEELHLQIEEQTNNSLRVLSVLTALLLPPTLVTGLFGMNVKGLPFTDTDSGFSWALLLILASSAAAFVVMKRIGLIR